VSQALRRDGWTVIRVKECAVRKASTLVRILRAVGSENGPGECATGRSKGA
jgi:G:T-mismatch repair DNA endonuclease (very short patch repair protein)